MLGRLINQFTKSGNFHSLAGNIIFAAFSMGTFLILVRLLDKAIFGQWVLFVTMASLLDMLRLGLTGTAAIRLLSRSNNDNTKVIGSSSYILGLSATLFIAILFFSGYYIIQKTIPTDSYYLYVLLYYPLLALVNLPFNHANILAQGKINFKRVMVLKTINGVFIMFLLIGYILLYDVTFQGIIISYIIANLLSSGIAIIAGWDELLHIGKASKETIKRILEFGKYSTASSVGSSLLRSSDTIILSLAPFLGAEAIAIYAIPLKFVEAVEIPLRSFSATAFPRLSKALIAGNGLFEKMLLKYTIGSTIILLPVVLILLSFPVFFLQIIGGPEYSDSLPLQKDILLIISFYILILPFDRYSGVALFALNKPKLNFYKILIMLGANIVFDLIAVFVFQSLIYVAMATLVFTMIGIITGLHMLIRETKPEVRNSFVHFFEMGNNYLDHMKSWLSLEK